jgi:hypothetical protein
LQTALQTLHAARRSRRDAKNPYFTGFFVRGVDLLAQPEGGRFLPLTLCPLCSGAG